MFIIEGKNYTKSYKKLLKNNNREQDTVFRIKKVFLTYDNLNEVLLSPYKVIYHIEQKKGNLKEYYTARINQKIRLIMKPVGSYPYNTIEITEIEFIDIDNKHYGEG